jgi:hypothetical protein
VAISRRAISPGGGRGVSWWTGPGAFLGTRAKLWLGVIAVSLEEIGCFPQPYLFSPPSGTGDGSLGSYTVIVCVYLGVTWGTENMSRKGSFMIRSDF